MNIVTVVVIGAIGTVISVVLKQYKPEYAIFISIITVIIILSFIISAVLPVITDMKSLLGRAGISTEHLSALVKSIGICYLSQFVCDVCRESGQTAIASKVELAARVSICVIALPLFKELISVIETIIGKVT